MQFIAPELKTFRQTPRQMQSATRVSAVSVLFEAIAIPIASASNCHRYQPRKEDAPPRRTAHPFASKRWESFIEEAPQSFRRHSPRHHPWVTVNGSRLPAVQIRVRTRRTCLALRQGHRLPSGSFLIRPLSLSTAFESRS